MSQLVELCPKCSDEMESGYLVDRSHGLSYLGQWARGIPKRFWWLLGSVPNTIKAPKNSDLLPIRIYRCKSCGFLESYARAEFAPK